MSIDREKLLYALAAVLTDQPRLPMELVAQQVGVSRATLHRMFPSREAVLAAVLQMALEVGLRTIEEAELERGPADRALARFIEKALSHGALHLFLATDRGERCAASDATEARWDPHRRRILALFQRGQEEGTLRVDLSAQWMMDAMAALMFAVAESTRTGRLAPADAVGAVLGVLLDGTRRRSVAPAIGAATAKGAPGAEGVTPAGYSL